MIHNLSETNSVLHHFMSEIRDEAIQKDRMRFRKNIERIGQIMAYEISKTIPYRSAEVKTPLGTAHIPLMEDQPVLATVQRAGVPMHHGFLNYFDQAGNAFVSAYRAPTGKESFEVRVEYLSCPSLDNKVLILCDPMLATGTSAVLTLEALARRGKASHVHLAAIIASEAGIDYVHKHIPDNITIWCAAVDKELNSKAYIVPGLGDAGDLAYGTKI